MTDALNDRFNLIASQDIHLQVQLHMKDSVHTSVSVTCLCTRKCTAILYPRGHPESCFIAWACSHKNLSSVSSSVTYSCVSLVKQPLQASVTSTVKWGLKKHLLYKAIHLIHFLKVSLANWHYARHCVMCLAYVKNKAGILSVLFPAKFSVPRTVTGVQKACNKY